MMKQKKTVLLFPAFYLSNGTIHFDYFNNMKIKSAPLTQTIDKRIETKIMKIQQKNLTIHSQFWLQLEHFPKKVNKGHLYFHFLSYFLWTCIYGDLRTFLSKLPQRQKLKIRSCHLRKILRATKIFLWSLFLNWNLKDLKKMSKFFPDFSSETARIHDKCQNKKFYRFSFIYNWVRLRGLFFRCRDTKFWVLYPKLRFGFSLKFSKIK